MGCTHATRKCPTCNTKASLKEIRVLYAKTLVATDTSEINRLKKQIEQVFILVFQVARFWYQNNRILYPLLQINNEKIIVESTLKNSNLKADLEISMLRQKISEYEKNIKFLRENIGPQELRRLDKKSYAFTSTLVTSVKLTEQGECRVLAHSNHLSLLVSRSLSCVFFFLFISKSVLAVSIITSNFSWPLSRRWTLFCFRGTVFVKSIHTIWNRKFM